MANNGYNAVTAAVGTQRQFGKQPENTYQKRLVDPSFSAGHSGVDYEADTLKRAFGIAGTAMRNEGEAMDKREHMFAEFAEDVARQNPEALLKAGTVQFLQEHSNFDLASNVYAKAVVDRVRGEYIRGQIKSKFENDLLNQPLEKTPADRVKAFEDTLNKSYEQYKGLNDNETAFASGFYSGQLKDDLLVANTYNKEKSEQIKQKTMETAVASLGDLAEKSMRQPIEETLKTFKTNMSMLDVTGFSGKNGKERYAIVSKFLNDVASYTGNGQLLEALKKEVYDKDTDGKPRTLGETFNFMNLDGIAGARGFSMRNAEVSDWLKEAKKCQTEEQLDALYEKTRQDPAKKYLYESVLPHRPSFAQDIKTAQEKREREALRNAIDNGNNNNKWIGFNASIEAWLAGAEKDRYGNVSSKLYYQKYDKDGKASWANLSDADATPFIQQYMSGIAQDSSLSEDERKKKMLAVLTHPDVKFYAKNMADIADRALANVELDTLPRDQDNNPVLPDSVARLIALRKYSEGDFALAFGDANTTAVDTIVSMQENCGDDKMGIKTYFQARKNLQDKNINAELSKEAKGATFNWNNFDDCWLGDRKATIDDSNTQIWENKMREQVKYLRASGMGDLTACQNIAMERLRKSMIGCRGGLIPRAIIKGYTPKEFAEGVDYLIDAYREDCGLGEDNPVSVVWDTRKRALELRSGFNMPVSYDVATLRNEAQLAQDVHAKATASKNVDAVDKSTSDFGGNVNDTTNDYADNRGTEDMPEEEKKWND